MGSTIIPSPPGHVQFLPSRQVASFYNSQIGQTTLTAFSLSTVVTFRTILSRIFYNLSYKLSSLSTYIFQPFPSNRFLLYVLCAFFFPFSLIVFPVSIQFHSTTYFRLLTCPANFQSSFPARRFRKFDFPRTNQARYIPCVRTQPRLVFSGLGT